MWVLLTGMSGAGKSTLVAELRARGFTVHDADADGWSEPAGDDGRWDWNVDEVAALLAREPEDLAFFAGTSESQSRLPFDRRVVLTAPRAVIAERLRTRTTNTYARDGAEHERALADLDAFEPRLRAAADLVLETTVPPAAVADALLAWLKPQGAASDP